MSGPYLKLHQCGLPKLMALELFKPFIMSRLVERKSAQNIKAAKKMVDSALPEVWDVLEEVIHEHPVLLNRAPTLHTPPRYPGVRAGARRGQGHSGPPARLAARSTPTSTATRWRSTSRSAPRRRRRPGILMLSSNNILSPAHGAPLTTPTQDMVLGQYYVTYGPEQAELSELQAKLVPTSGRRQEAPARVPHRTGS